MALSNSSKFGIGLGLFLAGRYQVKRATNNPNGNFLQQLAGTGPAGESMARGINGGRNYCIHCHGLVSGEVNTCRDHNQRVSNSLTVRHLTGFDQVRVVYSDQNFGNTIMDVCQQMNMMLSTTGYVQRPCPSLYEWAPWEMPTYAPNAVLPHMVLVPSQHYLTNDPNCTVDNMMELMDSSEAIRRGIVLRMDTPFGAIDRTRLNSLTSA